MSTLVGRVLLVVTAACLGPSTAFAGTLQHRLLQRTFERIVHDFDGRVGVCAQDNTGTSCVAAGQRFSLQSVMKLVVGVAVMDAIDRRGWRLDDQVTVRREDLSVFVQPIAALVGDDGFRTTVDDLVRRAIVDSDSAATDVLVSRLGGPPAIQRVLDRLGIGEVRFDRDERQLQTEIHGLVWRPEYVDAARLERAIAAVPEPQRDVAWGRYRQDRRDTATPRGMTTLLHRLAAGELLSPASTARLLAIMDETVTFPGRLKAGIPPTWSIGHKTGTSSDWRGVTAATNDVGVLTAPDGTRVSLAVFIADSRVVPAQRAALMARLAQATVESYRADAERGECTLTSAARRIRCELLVPTDAGVHPGVVLLHGRGGIPMYGPRLRDAAARLTGRGYTVLIVNYFDATGDSEAPDITAARFAIWRQAVSDAVGWLAARGQIDPERIAVAGISLGGYLASTAAHDDARIAVVASHSAGPSEFAAANPARMAPTLIAHAAKDPIVPVSDARRLAAQLQARGVPHELHEYASSEHLLEGDAWNQAWTATITFFDRVFQREQ